MKTEFELRYRVEDPEPVRVLALASGFCLSATETVVDMWYAPAWIRSYTDHERWLASSEAAPLRVRKVRHADESALSLEIKRPVHVLDFTENVEASLPLPTSEHGDRFARALGYEVLAVLEKDREVWTSDDCHLSIDIYRSKDIIVELELPPNTTPVDFHARCALIVQSDWDPLGASAALELIRRELAA